MNQKIYAVIGIITIVAFLLPALSASGAVPAVARAKPGTTTGVVGIGSAGPASKAGADGIVKKFALCVGVSDYKSSNIGDLSYCDEDATDWAAYFNGKGYAVTKLIDSQAKESSIESALFGIIAAADADDKIVFATSGHGTTSDKVQLLLYYDCYDPATDGDGFVSGIVPDKELYNWFKLCTSKVDIIVDHCNSGGLNEVVYGHTNLLLQCTCGATGYGYDVPEYQNGAFTYWYLHKALQEQGFADAEAAFAWVKLYYPYKRADAPVQYDSLTGNFVF
jgi:uncharacterized caspase-like protein